MNDIRIAELEQLNSNYFAGQAELILYRCNLLASFLFSLSDHNEGVRRAYIDWLDICDEYQMEMTESIIEYYKEGNLYGADFILADKYPEYFERSVDFLLGKVQWEPDASLKNAAVASSKQLTAQMLEHLLTK